MCLILFAWQAHARYSLVVAANRDEFHERPTAAADFWEDSPDLLAGRDLQAGGTWLGITRQGRFAAITNYREPRAPEPVLARSRGHLVRDFLEGGSDALVHAEALEPQGPAYSGFNLLLGTPAGLAWFSNRNGPPRWVEPGVHGLSNHLLDTDWPKVHAGREHLEALLAGDRIEPGALFSLLTDRALTPGKVPEDVEASLVPEQLAKHYFIVSPVYGTRSSTVLLVEHSGRVLFMERQFSPAGTEIATRSFNFP